MSSRFALIPLKDDDDGDTSWRPGHDIRNVGLCLGRPVKNKQMLLIFYFGIILELELGLKLE